MTSVLIEADSLINGTRQDDYGTPDENFAVVANLWTAYTGFVFSVDDVCIMMTLLKIARLKTGEKYHRDSVVDGCGYLGLLELVEDRTEAPSQQRPVVAGISPPSWGTRS